ncbi:MAG: hypothetical protein JST54_02695 [Deltaproteobacteria bacterium]|nr:hypothetical protein [Deltaproteobacteria bacterium]
MPVRLLHALSTSDVEPLSHLGWPDGPCTERISIQILRPATADRPLERVRFTRPGYSVDAELDLSSREPHQIGSIRLQCAIAASTFGQSGLLIHGAGLALEGRGAVAAFAPSGGGKSTLSNLAERFIGLSDETVLLVPGPPPQLFATPLRSSSTKVPEPRVDPLRALLILEKSLEPSFTRLKPDVALKQLLLQAYKLPPELAPPAQVFKRAAKLVENVPAYRFAFPKSPLAQDLLLRLFDDELSPEIP